MKVLNNKDFRDKLLSAKEIVYKQIEMNLGEFPDSYPHVSEDGIYPDQSNKLWTASFYPGMTYLAYEDTKDMKYMANRESYLTSFEERMLTGHMITHDIGFLFLLTHVKDYLLFKEPKMLQVAKEAADKLMIRYNPGAECIQAWGPVDPADDQIRIIIDTMMNVEFLFRMAKLTGNNDYYEAAYKHAWVSSKTLIREDASSYHTYYLTKNGDFIGGKTHQGHRDESTWARGQAWAVYGFSQSYLLTGESHFLETAIKTADVFIENLPKDFVHYWDFDFDDNNQDIKDSSAASVGAMGLILLSQSMTEEMKKELKFDYLEMAKLIMDSLIDNYLIKDLLKGQGLLREGMYHRDEGFNEFTSWGDYYFVEALQAMLDMNE